MTDYIGCRWTLRNLEGDVHGPLTHAGDDVEVMPVSEHQDVVLAEIRRAYNEGYHDGMRHAYEDVQKEGDSDV